MIEVKDKYEKIIHFFEKVYIYLNNSNELENYINRIIDFVDQLYPQESLSMSEKGLDKIHKMKLLKQNYYKIFFVSLTTLFSYNIELFSKSYYLNSLDLNETYLNLMTKYNNLISLIFLQFSIEFEDPQLTAYLLAFSTDFESIKINLSELAKTLKSDKYQKLSNEINLHFAPFFENITTFIAIRTNIYTIVL